MVVNPFAQGLRRWARYRNVAGDQCPIQAAILDSFGLRFKPWTTYPAALRTEMSRRKSVKFQDHSLLTARLSGEKKTVHPLIILTLISHPI